jgi:phage terminase small subunit
MTPKQMRFVAEYALDGNGTAAAIRAGYAKTGAHVTACRLLKNPKVAEALLLSQRPIAQHLEIDRHRVLNGLLEGIDLARAQCNAMGMLAGWREIGKMLGYYAPEKKAVVVTELTQREISRFEGMSDEELLALSAGAKH